MALDKDGEIDIDKTVEGIVEDILPPEPVDPPDETTTQRLDEKVDEKVDEKTDEKVEEKVDESKKIDKPALKEGDEGYVPPPEPKTAPKSWGKEMHEEFGKLPPTVQEYVLKREEDYTNGISQYKQAADYARAVHSVIQPYMAHIQARGNTVGDHMKMLLNADYTLSYGAQDAKVSFLQQIMQSAGITKEMLGETPAQKDPAVLALEKQVQDMRGSLTEQQTAALEEKRAEIAKAVDAFAADPKNVYFKELSDDIVKLIGAGYTLQDAYEKAVWANPATRAKEQVRLDKDKGLAAKKAAEEAALKAKKAARQNVKETPSSRSAPTSLLGSIDDTLRTTMRSIKERSS